MRNQRDCSGVSYKPLQFSKVAARGKMILVEEYKQDNRAACQGLYKASLGSEAYSHSGRKNLG